jgi:hypothetical protein
VGKIRFDNSHCSFSVRSGSVNKHELDRRVVLEYTQCLKKGLLCAAIENVDCCSKGRQYIVQNQSSLHFVLRHFAQRSRSMQRLKRGV